MRAKRYFVYIMSSTNRTLYVGFTSDLELRVHQHKTGTFEGFTSRYQIHALVYFEECPTAYGGISR